jgi:hypothetical protein
MRALRDNLSNVCRQRPAPRAAAAPKLPLLPHALSAAPAPLPLAPVLAVARAAVLLRQALSAPVLAVARAAVPGPALVAPIHACSHAVARAAVLAPGPPYFFNST